ncbi:MAG: hypothetical protein F6J93_37235 [Oscillatoria sp. SIO1A7]|nr:hypothetical protein [Oscillatoria sp. SIO1A7]
MAPTPQISEHIYGPVFATTVWQPEQSEPGTATVCCFDFFTANSRSRYSIPRQNCITVSRFFYGDALATQ